LEDEEAEVLEASVQMSLGFEGDNLVEMRVIDVRIHAEQPLEDVLYTVTEISGERDTLSALRRANGRPNRFERGKWTRRRADSGPRR
jgi:hypothetical protein